MAPEKAKPKAEEKPQADSKAADQDAKPDPKAILKGIVALLENSVSAKDTRLLMGRLMRQTAALRKDLSAELLGWFVKHHLDSGVASYSYLLQALEKVRAPAPGAMAHQPTPRAGARAAPAASPDPRAAPAGDPRP
jgi:26S proteasome regulatory subunit N3